jgi:hypothetical protein
MDDDQVGRSSGLVSLWLGQMDCVSFVFFSTDRCMLQCFS